MQLIYSPHTALLSLQSSIARILTRTPFYRRQRRSMAWYDWYGDLKKSQLSIRTLESKWRTNEPNLISLNNRSSMSASCGGHAPSTSGAAARSRSSCMDLRSVQCNGTVVEHPERRKKYYLRPFSRSISALFFGSFVIWSTNCEVDNWYIAVCMNVHESRANTCPAVAARIFTDISPCIARHCAPMYAWSKIESPPLIMEWKVNLMIEL